MNERRHEPVFPGFAEMAERRRVLTDELVARRVRLGLSQTQVAARMGTSQSAVARLESGDGPSLWHEWALAELLDRRTVLLTGELDEDRATAVAAELMLLDGSGDEP